jgi:hypothetical protein
LPKAVAFSSISIEADAQVVFEQQVGGGKQAAVLLHFSGLAADCLPSALIMRFVMGLIVCIICCP